MKEFILTLKHGRTQIAARNILEAITEAINQGFDVFSIVKIECILEEKIISVSSGTDSNYPRK